MSRWPAKEIMETRILDTAEKLFYWQGIRGVGVDTIAAEAGVSKRTLYNHFPSKDALIIAYLTRRAVLRKGPDGPPLKQLLYDFDYLERWFASKTFRGCPFVNAVAELGEPAHPAVKIAAGYKMLRIRWFTKILTEIGVPDPKGLATQVAMLVDGAIAAALVHDDPRMASTAKAAARVLLTTAGVPDPDVSPSVRQTRNGRGRKALKRPAASRA